MRIDGAVARLATRKKDAFRDFRENARNTKQLTREVSTYTDFTGQQELYLLFFRFLFLIGTYAESSAITSDPISAVPTLEPPPARSAVR